MSSNNTQDKFRVLKNKGSKCDRCWSSKDLDFYFYPPEAKDGYLDLTRVVLCANCRRIVPEDPILFHLFLEFASPKEMIKHYNVNTEIEAIEAWCSENNVDINQVLKKLGLKSRRESIKATLRKKALRGEICGFNSPFGYKFEDGKLVIVESEAEIVKKMFNLYSAGQTIQSIVDTLNSLGVKTKRNKKWSVWAVRRILKNPIYAGYIKWDNIVRRGEHKAIIEREQYNKVQNLLNKRSKRGHSRPIIINDGGPSLMEKTEHQLKK